MGKKATMKAVLEWIDEQFENVDLKHVDFRTQAKWRAEDALRRVNCKRCSGSGEIDDAEPGDIFYNKYDCPDCRPSPDIAQ